MGSLEQPPKSCTLRLLIKAAVQGYTFLGLKSL